MLQRLDPKSEKLAAVLVVSPCADDHHVLRTIFSNWNWKLNAVSTMEEARSWMMRQGPPSIVICERDLPEGSWKLLFQETEALPRPPKFIVSSRVADEYLWSEVLNLGGHDVLSTPFEAREVGYVVRGAWDSWQRQWAMAAPARRPAVSASQIAASLTLRAGAGS